ncbi:hypothetical protein FRC03_012384 [Tulasnella sp. 419]|nr:hypothetical protein FRC03_012384 [Tulasnella sp. 419]
MMNELRKHCANKVHRLRKTLKLIQGKGKEFKKHAPITSEILKDGHIQLLLFETERAWAYAQELFIEHGKSKDSSVRKHALSRFRRASTYATQLFQHATTIYSSSASRISILSYAEIITYHLIIQGRLSRAKEEFQDAIAQLSVARSLLDKLSSAATTSRDQALYTVFGDEIGPEIRYSAHELGRSKSYDIDGVVAEYAPKHGESQIKGYKSLLDNITATSSTSGSGAKGRLGPIDWEGQPVPIRSPELVDAFLKVQDAVAKLDAGHQGATAGDQQQSKAKRSRSKVVAFDGVLSALSDAEDLSRKLLEGHQGTNNTQSSEPGARDAVFVHSFISFQLLARRIQRDLILVDALIRSAPTTTQGTKSDDKSYRQLDPRVYPAVVKNLDSILQSLDQMRTLTITDESPEISAGVDARISYSKARRCHYISLAHASIKNYPQSLALNSRAQLHLRESSSMLSSSGGDTPLAELYFYPLTSQHDLTTLQTELETNALQLKKSWFAYNGGSLEAKKVGKKPLFFDVAFNYLESPMERLEIRAGKEPKEKPSVSTGVGIAAPVVGGAGQKGKVDVEETEEEAEETEEVETRQPQQRSGGLSSLLGGWWGRR